MIIGELVEILIRLRDGHKLSFREDEAVCCACNILDQLPSMEDAYRMKEALAKEKEAKRKV